MSTTCSTPICRHCAHFCNDPKVLEQAMPGIASLSSAYGSVRSDDGLCARHDRYLSAQSGCSEFSLVVPHGVTSW